MAPTLVARCSYFDTEFEGMAMPTDITDIADPCPARSSVLGIAPSWPSQLKCQYPNPQLIIPDRRQAALAS